MPGLGAVALAVLLMPGCALVPGIKMDEDAAVRRGRATTQDEQFRVQSITSNLILQLTRDAVPVTRQRDPLAGAPPSAYTIAPHDVLQVTVWDHPELTVPTGQFRSPEENGNAVGADGSIFYPHVGVLQVAGKTVAEVRAILTQRLSRVIEQPQLDVRVAGYHGKRAQVTGEVVAPTAVPITNVPLRVQDAIAAARGFTPEADPAQVTLSRAGQPYSLDLQALYEGGDLTQNWLLQDGDVIHVSDRNRNRVYVMGEVRQQQAKLMTRGRMTLAEAIGESGGFDLLSANTSKVYVLRGDFDAPSIYRLDASSPDALLLAARFPLRPADVVFVSTNELTRWNRVVSQIVPTVQVLYEAAVTADIATRSR